MRRSNHPSGRARPDHDDDLVSGSATAPRRGSLEGDAGADTASGDGEGDEVGVEAGDHSVWVGKSEGDRQPAFTATDHGHSPRGSRHACYWGLRATYTESSASPGTSWT